MMQQQQHLQQHQRRHNRKPSPPPPLQPSLPLQPPLPQQQHQRPEQNLLPDYHNICTFICTGYQQLSTTIITTVRRCRLYIRHHHHQQQLVNLLKQSSQLQCNQQCCMINMIDNNNNNIMKKKKKKNVKLIISYIAILFLMMLLLLLHQVYSYYLYTGTTGMVDQEAYYYNYTYYQEQSRNLRFPSIEQRVQLYMSHWYYHPSIPYCSNNNADTGTHPDHYLNHTERTIVYSKEKQHSDYQISNSNRINRNTIKRKKNEYSYELSVIERIISVTTGNKYDTKSLGTTRTNVPPKMIVTNQMGLDTTIFNMNHNHYVSLYQCYKNKEYIPVVRYDCRDMFELILHLQYNIPFSIIRTILKYNFTFYYIFLPYIKYFHKKNKDMNDVYGNDLNWSIPILVQFSDETDSFVYIQKDKSGNNNSTVLSKVTNPYLPYISKKRHALPKSIIDHIMTRTTNEHYSLLPPPSSSLPLYNDNNNDNTKTQYPTIQHPSCYKYNPFLQSNQQQFINKPIIWLTNRNRHYKNIKDMNDYDIPYHLKLNATIFRGMLTGSNYIPDRRNNNTNDTYLDQCLSIPRCQFVYNMYNSSIVNAKITDTVNILPNHIDGHPIVGANLLNKDILKYKGIVIVEGNNISPELQWAMISNSVVLMSPPQYTSYMMEELLEPYIHYIPLKNDLSNVEEQTRWMIRHPYDVQRIVHRAKLWILDLYNHPQAFIDQCVIFHEILLRYQQHFVEDM